MAGDESGAQHHGCAILGKMPDDMDLLPVTLPDGFFAAIGGARQGSPADYPMADCRVAVGKRCLDFHITLDDARHMRRVLDEAIRSMEICTDGRC